MPPKYKRLFPPKDDLSKKEKKAVSKMIKRSLKRTFETKYYDFMLSLQPASNVVGIASIFAPPQGLQDINRIGDVVKVKSVMFNFQVGQPIATAAGVKDNHSVRVLMIQWKGESVPTAANIFSTIATTDVALSTYNEDSLRELMHVLYDRTFYLHDTSNQLTGVMNKYLRRYRRNITFRAGNLIPLDGQFYFVISSDYAAAVGELQPRYNFRSRVTYTDA